MAWKSVVLTQNGNSTRDWLFEGGPLSSHDAVVLGPTSGNSKVRLIRTDVGINPNSYRLRVQVVGSGAMAYRFYAERMN